MSEGRRNLILYVLAPVAAFCVIYLCLSIPGLSKRCDRGGDYALIGLEVQKAKNFEVLTGPYSRFGFRHPGPVLFYYYAALEPFLPFIKHAQARYSLAQFLLNSLLILTAIYAFAKYSGTAPLGWLLLLLILFVFLAPRRGLLQDIWNPSAIVCAVLTFQIASAALACGRRSMLIPWTASALLAVSHHLGSLVVVGPIGLLALLCLIKQQRSETLSWKRNEIVGALTAFAFVIAAVLGPVLESFLYDGGNLYRLQRFLAGSAQMTGHTLEEAWRFMASFYRAPLSALNPPRFLPVLLAVFLPYALRLEPKSFLAYLRMFNLFAYALSLWGATRIEGKLYGYVMMYHYAFVVIAYLFCILAIARWVSVVSRLRVKSVGPRWALSLKIAASALVFSAVVVLAASHAVVKKRAAAKARNCEMFFESAVSQLKVEPGQRIAVSLHSKGTWGTAAGLVSYLYREGFDVCVPTEWGFMFGKDRICPKIASTQPLARVRIFTWAELPPSYALSALRWRDIAIVTESAVSE